MKHIKHNATFHIPRVRERKFCKITASLLKRT